MSNRDIKILKKEYWRQASGWVLLIYLTIPVVKPVCELLKKFAAFSISVNTFLLFLVAIVFFVSLKKIAIKRISSYFLIFALGAAYIYFLATLKIPEERIHLAEYGLLGFLVHRAVRLDIKNLSGYLVAFIVTGILGAIDEFIQYFVPNRYCQLSDMILNLWSGGLGLGMTYILRKDTWILEETENFIY